MNKQQQQKITAVFAHILSTFDENNTRRLRVKEKG